MIENNVLNNVADNFEMSPAVTTDLLVSLIRMVILTTCEESKPCCICGKVACLFDIIRHMAHDTEA